MKLFQLLISFLLPLGLLATDTLLPSTKSICNTKVGRKSIKVVPTSQRSTTTTLKITQYLTTTPLITETIVPATSTSTIVESSTITESLNQVTDTFFLTNTVTIPTTIELPALTSTITETTTETTVVNFSTLIPTPSGWLPAPSTIPSGTPSRRGLRLRDNKNDRDDRNENHDNDRNDDKDEDDDIKTISCTNPKPIFPKEVTCYVIVQTYKVIVITKTASKSTITLSQATSTAYVTTTSLTTVKLPNASTTSTIITTEFSTVFSTPAPSTTTTTATLTATVQNPTVTGYAACAPQNSVAKVGGHSIDYYTIPGTSFNPSLGGINKTPTTCCESCMSNASCGSWVLNPNGACYLILASGVCDVPGLYRHSVNAGTGTGLGQTVGNGYCVQIN